MPATQERTTGRHLTCHSIPAAILVVAINFLLSDCSTTQTQPKILDAKVAPGAVTVDVLEGGQPERYWQYKVQPAGLVRLIEEKTFADYRHEDIDYSVERGGEKRGLVWASSFL